jgi:hypothetical protein
MRDCSQSCCREGHMSLDGVLLVLTLPAPLPILAFGGHSAEVSSDTGATASPAEFNCKILQEGDENSKTECSENLLLHDFDQCKKAILSVDCTLCPPKDDLLIGQKSLEGFAERSKNSRQSMLIREFSF